MLVPLYIHVSVCLCVCVRVIFSVTRRVLPSTAAWRTRSSPTGCSSPSSPCSSVCSSTRWPVSHLPGCPPQVSSSWENVVAFIGHCVHTSLYDLRVIRCVRLSDVWTGRGFRHLDVLPGRWRGHDYCQTALWNIHYHHLPHYPAPGQVSPMLYNDI